MAANSPTRIFLIFLIFAGFVPLLHSQNTETENDEPHYLQRLIWAGGEYALRYEVVLEREVNGRYRAYSRKSTETPFIEILLPLGKYRFQVTSYNILDKPEEVSQWIYIEARVTASNEEPEQPDAEKPIMLFASAAWSPVLPIHGNSFGEGFSAAGAGARVAVVFSAPRGLRIGAEVPVFWHKIADAEENANMLSLGVNLLAMKWLSNQKTALNLRLGFSINVMPEIENRLMFNIGASYLWRFSEKFLFETGLDYSSLLKEKHLDGCIRPFLGFGFIFF